MDYLVACTTVKNESRYIYEWLSYHHHIGVEHFYVYDNGSTDNTKEVIRNWPKSDLVTLLDWPGSRVQHLAYIDMINNRRGAAEWCAFIDADEFLCPMGSVPVPDMLRLFSTECEALYVHWMIFGSSGLLDRGDGLVTEDFIRRGPSNFGPNRIGKTVLKLRHATQPKGVHVIQVAGRMINDGRAVIDQENDGFHDMPSHRYLSLNHYFTKSLAEWRLRRSYGRATQLPDSPDYKRTEEQFKGHDANHVEDRRAFNLMQQAKASYY